MTSTALATQRTFDFDMATLNSCIATLKPKPLRTLFRGLLLTAAMEPRRVTDIDDSGFVMMTAPMLTVANWSGVTERAIQRGRDANQNIVSHCAGPNTPSEWFFNLRSALPDEAVDWFCDLVENSKMSPRQNENVTPTFCTARGDILQNVTPTFSNLSSICFQLNTASLAVLAEKLKSQGIAVGGIEWQTLHVEDSALAKPEAVAAIADVVAANDSEKLRVFVAAVVSQAKERPWNYFRSLIVSGNFLTTNATKQQLRTAETMLRFTNGTDASEIVPTTGDEAWARVLAGMRRWDYMHQLAELKAELGPDIHAAVRAAGGFAKIGQTDKTFQHNNRRAFLDAWTTQHTVSTALR